MGRVGERGGGGGGESGRKRERGGVVLASATNFHSHYCNVTMLHVPVPRLSTRQTRTLLDWSGLCTESPTRRSWNTRGRETLNSSVSCYRRSSRSREGELRGRGFVICRAFTQVI